MENNNNLKRYLVVAVIFTIVGILLAKRCSGEQKPTKTVVKYDTIIKTKTISVVNEKPVIKYVKGDTKYITNTDTIIQYFKPLDYQYTINDTISKNGSLVYFSANGWGSLDNYNIDIKTKDTTIIKTIDNTIYKTPNTLYLYGQYNTPFTKESSLKPLYTIGLDYTMKNRIIIGTNVTYQNDSFFYGGKIGFKLK